MADNPMTDNMDAYPPIIRLEPEKASLSDEWRQWIATNLMNGAPGEEILRILLQEGFPDELARTEIHLALTHPYFAAGKAQSEKLKKRDWALNCLSQLQEMSPYNGQIDQRYRISREAFFEQYYFRNRPVLIQGALSDWPALERWTPEYLKSQCGQQIIEVQYGREQDPDYEINQAHFKKQLPFAECIDLIHDTDESNNFYITANNTGTNGQALQALWKDAPVIGEYLKTTGQQYPGFFWYGPKGTITPLHHDLTNNFMAQVKGRKLVRMVPPSYLPHIYNYRHCYSSVDLGNIDYTKFPAMRNVRMIDVILEPGDLLFLPIGYWHYVRGLDISITMTFTNFLHSNDFNSFYDSYGVF